MKIHESYKVLPPSPGLGWSFTVEPLCNMWCIGVEVEIWDEDEWRRCVVRSVERGGGGGGGAATEIISVRYDDGSVETRIDAQRARRIAKSGAHRIANEDDDDDDDDENEGPAAALARLEVAAGAVLARRRRARLGSCGGSKDCALRIWESNERWRARQVGALPRSSWFDLMTLETCPDETKLTLELLALCCPTNSGYCGRFELDVLGPCVSDGRVYLRQQIKLCARPRGRPATSDCLGIPRGKVPAGKIPTAIARFDLERRDDIF